MRDVEICVLGVFSPPPHTASPTPNTHSRLKYVSEHGVLGLDIGLVVRAEAGVVEGVLRVDLRTRIEAQSVGPRTQSERHNHTAPAREPARLATLRGYGAERRAFGSLRRRAHRAPILPRARPSQPLDGLSGSPSRSFKSRPIEPTSFARAASEPRTTMDARGHASRAHGGAAGQRRRPSNHADSPNCFGQTAGRSAWLVESRLPDSQPRPWRPRRRARPRR